MAGKSWKRGRTPQKKQQGGGGGGIGGAVINGFFSIITTFIQVILGAVAKYVALVLGVVLLLDVVITNVKPLKAMLGSMPITSTIFGVIAKPLLPWIIGGLVVLAISWLLRNGPALLEKWEPYLSRGGRGGRSEEDNWARGAPGGGWGDKPPLTRPGGTRRQAPEPRQAEPPQRRQRTRPAPRQAEPRERRQRTRPQ